MRNLKQILLTILVLTFITACDKDENDPKETLEKVKISAKWNVDNSSEYESFEFNESGNYIVLKNTTTKSTKVQVVLFGTYEIIDAQKINLTDFGTLTISDVNENSINFSIILTNNLDNETIINASKQDEIESSKKTDLLCRTWEMVTKNGIPTPKTNIVFSKAGTYFISYANPKDENQGSLAKWKWNNDEETQLLYSWKKVPNWEEEHYVEIPELTTNTLKIVEDENTWVLQPISNLKSAD